MVDTANRVIGAHGGSPLDFDVVGGMTGTPLEGIFRIACPDLSDADAATWRTEYRDIYEREVIPATRLFRGARATLQAFHRQGLRQATVTGKRAADCERILRGLRIEREIDAYLGGDSVSHAKPAPDLALEAARRVGCDPRECVVVGDAPADIEMGRAAGMTVIQVAWGYARRRLLEADLYVRSWPELQRAVFALTAGRAILP